MIDDNAPYSIVYELKGDENTCPTLINISLSDISKINAFYNKRVWSAHVEEEILKETKIHIRGGQISFYRWYLDETIFMDEPVIGISGPKKAKIKVILNDKC